MSYSVEIKIHRISAKLFLWLSQFFNDNNFVLVCKGYGGDDDLYTGLCWVEDRELDLEKDDSYSDFRLWIN